MKKSVVEPIQEAANSPSVNVIRGEKRRRTELEKQNQQQQLLQQQQDSTPNWGTLPTGLEMLFNSEIVKKFWSVEKPKHLIAAHTSDVLKRGGVIKNFESVELNIITEFHLYTLIFAKQTILLDDQQAAVLMSIMWSLLINDNKEYGQLEERLGKAIGRTLKEQQLAAGKKTIQSDLNAYQIWINKHAKEEIKSASVSVKVFEKQHVAKIVEFTKEMYFANFSLYSHSLNNKNKNEEIRIQLFVDVPAVVPPLNQALYMGKTKIEIPEDDEDKKEDGDDGTVRENESQEGQIEDEEEKNQNELEGSHSNTHRPNSEENSIRKFVTGRLKKVEEQFSSTLEKRQADMNQQYEDIVNPKKKK